VPVVFTDANGELLAVVPHHEVTDLIVGGRNTKLITVCDLLDTGKILVPLTELLAEAASKWTQSGQLSSVEHRPSAV